MKAVEQVERCNRSKRRERGYRKNGAGKMKPRYSCGRQGQKREKGKKKENLTADEKLKRFQ